MTQPIDLGRELRQPLSQPRHYASQMNSADYRGQKVSFRGDATSMLADAAEELSFQFSEKVEKKLAKRNIHTRAGRRTSALERAEFYLNKLPDLKQDSDKLTSFTQELERAGRPTPRELRERARRHFDDASHAFAALVYARESLADNAQTAALAADCEQAACEELADHGPLIRAGLNTTASVRSFAENGLADVRDLRRFYRDTVLQYEGFEDTYRSILNHYPESEFPRAAAFLLKAVGEDLHARGPSIEPVELKRILDDLFTLEVLTATFRACERLPAKIEKAYGDPFLLSGGRLLGRLLDLKTESFLEAEQVLALVAACGTRQPGATIYLLRESLTLIRGLPLKAFADDRERTVMIGAFREAQDRVIAQEEDRI